MLLTRISENWSHLESLQNVMSFSEKELKETKGSSHLTISENGHVSISVSHKLISSVYMLQMANLINLLIFQVRRMRGEDEAEETAPADDADDDGDNDADDGEESGEEEAEEESDEDDDNAEEEEEDNSDLESSDGDDEDETEPKEKKAKKEERVKKAKESPAEKSKVVNGRVIRFYDSSHDSPLQRVLVSHS